MARLDGKVAIITGAGRGIGREVAMRLASEGAAVCVNYSRSEEGARLVPAGRSSAGAWHRVLPHQVRVSHYST